MDSETLTTLSQLTPVGILIVVLGLVILQQVSNQKAFNARAAADDAFKTSLLTLLASTNQQRDKMQSLIDAMETGLNISIQSLTAQIALQGNANQTVLAEMKLVRTDISDPDRIKARLAPFGTEVSTRQEQVSLRESGIIQSAIADIKTGVTLLSEMINQQDQTHNWTGLSTNVEAVRVAVVALQSEVRNNRVQIIDTVKAIPSDTARVLLPTLATAIDPNPTPVPGTLPTAPRAGSGMIYQPSLSEETVK